MKPTFTLFHADHGITKEQLAFIQDMVAGPQTNDGFFIQQVVIPQELGTVPCAIHGPVMGDKPVTNEEVVYEARGDRPWKDRLVRRDARQVSYVQVIGIRDGNSFQLFTIYGGPVAPQNPDDPSNKDIEGSITFWSQHALSM